jgi:hypothetical protein
MKKYNFLLLVLVLIFSSCKKYLTEDNTFKKSDAVVYSTPAAIEQLVATCYSYNRMWYGKEAAFTMSDGGTDIWYNGKDNAPSLAFATYQGLTADNYSIPFDQYWEGFYAGINLCNTVEDLTLKNTSISDANKKKYLAQARFLRAFYYWHLVETWGPVPLHLEPITDPSTIAERNSVDEIYTQMFKDVQYAIDNLSPSEPASSKVTYWAAKAFKARLALYYASAEYGHTEYYAKTLSTAAEKDCTIIMLMSGIIKIMSLQLIIKKLSGLLTISTQSMPQYHITTYPYAQSWIAKAFRCPGAA